MFEEEGSGNPAAKIVGEAEQKLKKANEEQTNKDYWRKTAEALAAANSGAIINFVTMLKFFPSIVKHVKVLGATVLPLEVLNYFFKIIKLWKNPEKGLGEKIIRTLLMTPSFIAIVVVLSAGILVGVHAGTFFGTTAAAIAPYSPFIFSGALGVYALLNLKGFVDLARGLYKRPWENTKLNKLRLTSKGVKTVALLSLAGAVVPLFMSLGALAFLGLSLNPATGPIFWAIAVAAVAAMVTMKIVKTIAEHRIQRDIAKTAANDENYDPYKILGIEKKTFDKKLLRGRYEAALGKVKEVDTKTKLFQAYELLKSDRARSMYEGFKTIKEFVESDQGKNFDPYGVLGIEKDSILPSLPAWLGLNGKRDQAIAKANKDQEHKINIAYQILLNGDFKEYFHEKKNKNENVADGKKQLLIEEATSTATPVSVSVPVPVIVKKPSPSIGTLVANSFKSFFGSCIGLGCCDEDSLNFEKLPADADSTPKNSG